MKPASIFIMLFSLLAVSSLQAKWSRIPIMQDKPVNVAMKGPHSAATIDSSAGIGQVDNLISPDNTDPSTLSAGNSFFIINFGKPVMVSTSSLVNDGVEGKVSLSASADKNGWAVLEEKVFSAADREINFKFAGIQAKFLKYDFALSKGGSIRSLTVMGAQTDRGYALKQDPTGQKGQPMNFTGGLGGARLVYAAPKPVNGIDSAAAFNKFEFPESDEKYRTLIYDMGQMRVLNEFASVHSPSPVRFEVFAFDKLPEKEDWRGRLAFDPADFNVAKPVVAYEDKVGTGSIKVKPAQPVKTRYLALRWEPDFNPPAFLIDSVSTMGNVMQVNGPTTRTYTVNGQQVTVTIDPGSAFAGGTDAGDGKVTITMPDGSTQEFKAAGVIVTESGIQIISGPDPQNALSALNVTTNAQGEATGGTTGDSGKVIAEVKSTTTTDGNGNTTTALTIVNDQNQIITNTSVNTSLGQGTVTDPRPSTITSGTTQATGSTAISVSPQ